MTRNGLRVTLATCALSALMVAAVFGVGWYGVRSGPAPRSLARLDSQAMDRVDVVVPADEPAASPSAPAADAAETPVFPAPSPLPGATTAPGDDGTEEHRIARCRGRD